MHGGFFRRSEGEVDGVRAWLEGGGHQMQGARFGGAAHGMRPFRPRGGVVDDAAPGVIAARHRAQAHDVAHARGDAFGGRRLPGIVALHGVQVHPVDRFAHGAIELGRVPGQVRERAVQAHDGDPVSAQGETRHCAERSVGRPGATARAVGADHVHATVARAHVHDLVGVRHRDHRCGANGGTEERREPHVSGGVERHQMPSERADDPAVGQAGDPCENGAG